MESDALSFLPAGGFFSWFSGTVPGFLPSPGIKVSAFLLVSATEAPGSPITKDSGIPISASDGIPVTPPFPCAIGFCTPITPAPPSAACISSSMSKAYSSSISPSRYSRCPCSSMSVNRFSISTCPSNAKSS